MSEIEAKAATLARRILTGNGFGKEEISLETTETRDLTIAGTLHLTPRVETETHPAKGPVPNAETLPSREEAQKRAAEYEKELTRNTPWLDDIHDFLKQEKFGGWGMDEAEWPVPRHNKSFLVTLTCDECHGKKTLPCDICRGQGKTQCETCRIQWAGQRVGQIRCPDCLGTTYNPLNQSERCQRCYLTPGFVPCPDCGNRGGDVGFILCRQCNGRGHKPCATCNGQGTITEETKLTVRIQARFELGATADLPAAVFEALDKLTLHQLAEQHAKVEPDAAETPAQLAYKATLPYARLVLTAGEEKHDISAFGLKPLLGDFPHLLDHTLRDAAENLSPDNLPKLARKYRLMAELTAALAAGQPPARFFARHYPYGISRDFALGLAKAVGQVFANVTRRPRLIAAALTTTLALASWMAWEKLGLAAQLTGKIGNLRPEVAHLTLALILTLLIWFVVDIAGRRTLSALMPKGAKVTRSTAGLIGAGAALLFLAAAAALHFSV